jgi:hypothetical protein
VANGLAFHLDNQGQATATTPELSIGIGRPFVLLGRQACHMIT